MQHVRMLVISTDIKLLKKQVKIKILKTIMEACVLEAKKVFYPRLKLQQKN